MLSTVGRVRSRLSTRHRHVIIHATMATLQIVRWMPQVNSEHFLCTANDWEHRLNCRSRKDCPLSSEDWLELSAKLTVELVACWQIFFSSFHGWMNSFDHSFRRCLSSVWFLFLFFIFLWRKFYFNENKFTEPRKCSEEVQVFPSWKRFSKSSEWKQVHLIWTVFSFLNFPLTLNAHEVFKFYF